VVLSHLFPNISSIVIPPNSFHRPKKGCVYRHFTQNSCRNLIKGVGIVCSAPHTIANTSPPLLLNESPWNITNQSTSEQIFIENTSLPRKVLGTRIYLFRLILTIIPVAYRDFKSHFFFFITSKLPQRKSWGPTINDFEIHLQRNKHLNDQVQLLKINIYFMGHLGDSVG